MARMERDLSRNLHRLTARLDRAADTFLRAEAGVSYPRFLALFLIGSEGADTQRALADRLGVSEPSVSRMVRVLVESGFLETMRAPTGGNRNQLRLTGAGEQLVTRWGAALEERLASLVDAAGVPYRAYLTHTRHLLAALETPPARRAWQPPAGSARPRKRSHA
jgi:DNA-binding MarR family transcriptional regulator